MAEVTPTPERLDEIRRLATHWTTSMTCRIAFAELIAALESTQGELNQLKSWLNAMRGPNAHRVGCDCGGGPGNGHYCGEIHRLMGWEGQFNAKVSP